jgi:hypothetical protein
VAHLNTEEIYLYKAPISNIKKLYEDVYIVSTFYNEKIDVIDRKLKLITKSIKNTSFMTMPRNIQLINNFDKKLLAIVFVRYKEGVIIVNLNTNKVITIFE